MKIATLLILILVSRSLVSQSLLEPALQKNHPIDSTLVFVKGGSFAMGDLFNDATFGEKPVHNVTVSDFYMGKTEVTFEQFDAFCRATTRNKAVRPHWASGKCPVSNVNWYDAVEYCNWLSDQQKLTPVYSIEKALKDTNNHHDYDRIKWVVYVNWQANGYRLPTEAEWEYAAREGGKKVRFGNGKDIARISEMNFDVRYINAYTEVATSRDQTVKVGSLNCPNAFGLHDMSGNLEEWCQDWFDGKYYGQSEGALDPKGPGNGMLRVARGGHWGQFSYGCRSTGRNGLNPGERSGFMSFRVVRR